MLRDRMRRKLLSSSEESWGMAGMWESGNPQFIPNTILTNRSANRADKKHGAAATGGPRAAAACRYNVVSLVVQVVAKSLPHAHPRHHAMRRIVLLLLPLLLTACVDDAATYYVDPGNN